MLIALALLFVVLALVISSPQESEKERKHRVLIEHLDYVGRM